MKRVITLIWALLALNVLAFAQNTNKENAAESKGLADTLLLKEYQPKSIYQFPKDHDVERAKYDVIDMHSHAYPDTEQGVKEWVQTMDENNIQKTLILTKSTGARFDSLYSIYSQYPDRFQVWCGIDYTGYKKSGFPELAINELERLYKKGCAGIGEMGDKGRGLYYSTPTKAFGMHLDDKRMGPILEKAGELGMPVSVHIAEPKWFYLPMDSTNDGLMNALQWRRDNIENQLSHDALLKTLENAVAKHSNTTFIAVHLGNSSYDLRIMGRMFDKYPNLYAGLGARYAELSQIPRHVKKFITKYQDRIVYGTDMGTDDAMYDVTFKVLETMAEHFYGGSSYHWSLNGFDLSDSVLKKIYNTNAKKILNIQ